MASYDPQSAAISFDDQPTVANAVNPLASSPSSVLKKRKHYDRDFKLKVIAYSEKCSNREAGRKFNVGESCIRDWKKNRSKLEQMSSKCSRLPGAGRKPCAPDMEETLAAWIDSQRSCHLHVTRSDIQKKAVQLYQGESDFLASRGCLERFLQRNGFSLRRRTTVSQSLPDVLLHKVSTFILHVRKLRRQHQYPLSAIGNMDETPVWLDMPGDTTVNRTGEQTISVRTTGHDKGRFTVILAAKADGTKLKPFIVFKGVHPVAALHNVSGVVVNMSRNGWMNEALTIKWIDSVWGRLSFQRRLLVWDAYRYNIKQTKKP